MSFLLWRSFQFKSHPHVMTTYVCRQRAVEEETKLCHLEGPLPFLLHIRSLPACLPPSPPLYEPIHQHYCEVIAFQINECVPGAEDADARPDDEEQGALCWLAHVSLSIYYLPDSGKQTRSSSRVSALQPSLSHSFTLLGFVVMDYDVIESKKVSRTSSSQLYC